MYYTSCIVLINLFMEELLNSWEETYKKGQLTLWIFLSLKDSSKYVDEMIF